MIVKYGTYAHDDNECQVAVARQSWRDADGQRRGYIERWSLSGMLRGAGADLVADLTTKIAALKAAYDEDDLDLVLYESDGSTETGHTLKTADTVGGTTVISGPSFPSGRGAEYATYRNYTITIEAKVEDTDNDLISFVEVISTVGTGASRFTIHTPLVGAPEVQVTAERTPVIVSQDGSAIGRASYPSIPVPVSLSSEHQDRRRVTHKSAERLPDGTYRNYEISWHFEFSTTSPSITGFPSFSVWGGGDGGVASHVHPGSDITSSYVREPYIDPLLARVSDIAAYVSTLQLDGLLDVNISAVADKELLTWDAGTSKWINRTAVEADIYTVVGVHTPFLDLQPAHTDTAQIIAITPSAAIGAGAHWDGIKMDLTALDPSGAGAFVHAVHIDATGVDLTNDPELHGLQVDLPTTYIGEADKCAGHFTGGGVLVELCDIELHAANFTQGQVNVDWNAANLSAGDTQDIYDSRIRTQGSTGGDIHVFAASRLSGGSVTVALLGTYEEMDIVHQHTGTFSTCDKAWKFNGGFTDVTAAFGDAGTDTQIFTSDNDYIYIGDAAKFSMLRIVLAIEASKSCLLAWEFSNGAGGWPSFGPSDQTHGFQNDGIISWNSDNLIGWATEAVNGSTQYWIRAQRTRNVLGTPPTEDTILILEPVVYKWDSAGDLSIHALAVDTISERTAAAGVTVDSCLIKDGLVADSNLLEGQSSAYHLALANATGELALTQLGGYAAQGDLIIGGAADYKILSVGTAGQILMADATPTPAWTTTFTADMLFAGSTKAYFDVGAAAGTEWWTSDANGFLDAHFTGGVRFYSAVPNLLLSVLPLTPTSTYTRLDAPVRLYSYVDGVRWLLATNGTTFCSGRWHWGAATDYITMIDNASIRLGSSADAHFYYNATNLIIDPDVVGTGKVYIGATADDDICAANYFLGTSATEYISSDNTNELSLHATQFVSVASGILIVPSDGRGIELGIERDLRIYFNGNNAIYRVTHVTGTAKHYFGLTGGEVLVAGIYESTRATGTSPFVVASTTLVSNLNADLLDSQEGSYYLDSVNFSGTDWTDLTDAGETTLHIHDDRYYTETEIDNAIALYLPLAGGTMSGDITMAEDGWIGIGAAATRIVFDGSAETLLLKGTADVDFNIHLDSPSTATQAYLRLRENGDSNNALTIYYASANDRAEYVAADGGAHGEHRFYKDVYVTNEMSALIVTDRSPFYGGDALALLRGIQTKPSDELDHGSLPDILRRENKDGEAGRDLGGNVSLNTRGIQQLLDRIEALEGRI